VGHTKGASKRLVEGQISKMQTSCLGFSTKRWFGPSNHVNVELAQFLSSSTFSFTTTFPLTHHHHSPTSLVAIDAPTLSTPLMPRHLPSVLPRHLTLSIEVAAAPIPRSATSNDVERQLPPPASSFPPAPSLCHHHHLGPSPPLRDVGRCPPRILALHHLGDVA